MWVGGGRGEPDKSNKAFPPLCSIALPPIPRARARTILYSTVYYGTKQQRPNLGWPWARVLVWLAGLGGCRRVAAAASTQRSVH